MPCLATVKFPTSVAFALDANGNLSITLLIPTAAGGLPTPPLVYPFVVQLCPAGFCLEIDISPTSVAFASEANGNLSIVFTTVAGGPLLCPPLVYPSSAELCPAAELLV